MPPSTIPGEPITSGQAPTIVVTHRIHDDVLALLASHAQVITNQTGATLPRSEIIAQVRPPTH
jgi:hypothetical protein